MNNRIVYLDRIKGFTILVVVLAHLYLFSLDMGDSLVFRFCASFEMPLFMFVSGFVAFLPLEKIAHSGGGIRKYKKRFCSYFCPAVAIGWILSVFQYVIMGVGLNFMDFLTGGAWYLKCMAIFTSIQFLMLNCRKLYQEIILIMVFWCLFVMGWTHGGLLNSVFCLEHCTLFFPYFILGYYARKYNVTDILCNRNWIFTIAIVVYACTFFCDIENRALRSLCMRVVTPLSAIVAIVYLFKNRENDTSVVERWLSKIGKQTLDIYIYHGFFVVGAMALNLFQLRDWAVATENYTICLFVALIATVFVAYLSLSIGKLIRTSNILSKIVYGPFVK